MNETNKRIKQYKLALPGLRERVAAVALLLVISTVMMTVSSFAWLTLSRAPEVKGVSTQITANGNLEIVLCGEDGVTPPLESGIGDSSATQGQSVLDANLTWGNLLNLSDPDYGLDQVILRPAVLNNAKLGSEPLRSVVYGEDGRVSHDQNSKFSYCTWESANEEIQAAHFGVTGKYGVRAIATVTERFESELGAVSPLMTEFYGRLSAAETENSRVDSMYQNELIGNKTHMSTLSAIVGLYMQAKMNHRDDYLMNPDCTDHIVNLSALYDTFLECMTQELTAMTALANVQQLVFNKSTSFVAYTPQTLRAATEEELAAKGVQLEGFTQFIADLTIVESDAEDLRTVADDVQQIGLTVKLDDIRYIIDNLVVVDSCVVKADETVTTIGAITGLTQASELASASDVDVEMQDGILPRFEQRSGTYMYLENQSVSVTIGHDKLPSLLDPMTQSVKVDIYTKYYLKECLFNDDVEWTQEQFDDSGIANGKKILTAGDTYGLAVDFWVRTNAADPETNVSYLVLEGEVLYEQDTGTDANGNSVGLLFCYTVEDETTGLSTDYYVYQTEDGKWYEDYAHHESNNEVTAATLAGKKLREVYQDAPVGYQGENRVWEEIQQATLQPQLSEYNTTQGSGSCYTFYADSPQDQQKILNLLKHMYVVFTDGGNGYLSMARFDTEENHYYEQGGKVTVPLVIMQSNYTFVNELGESVDAVAELQPNVATRITAMVYLDGKELTNKEALSASDIQGTLNIQFGNNIAMTTLGDQELQQQERIVTATVETENNDNVLDFFTDDLSAKVTVNVTGDQPATVTAFFQREINAYQGSRQQTMTFSQEDNSWVCDDFTFPAPGKYVLRSVMLDGEEYELREAVVVTVQGIVLSTLEVTRSSQIIATRDNTIMTADNSVSLNLAATFATDDANKLPKKMVVEFVRPEDGSSISVQMSPTTTGWTGNVSFTTSGYYEMQYMVLDDQRYDLESYAKTFDLYLGLSAQVEAMPGTPQIVPLEDDQGVTLSIRAKIVDNNGGTVDNLTDFPLYYRGESSGEQLEAVVSWNSTSGYYEGNFHVTVPDTYRFYYLQTQGNYIAASKSAVVFRARSNKPASYVSCDNSGNTVFVLPGEGVAELLVNLKNTGGAQINAYFENSKGQTYTVGDELIESVNVVDGVTKWKIPVPTVDGSQAGMWTLTKLALGNVTDSNGREYTLENPLNILLAEQSGGAPTLTVITDFEIKLNSVSKNSFSGEFMQAHTVSDLSVELYFKDADGNAVQLPAEVTLSDVTLHYVHQNDSEALGSYKISSTVAEIAVGMSDSGDGATYVQAADMTLRTAGTYKLKNITYKLNSKEYTVTATAVNSTQFTVTSIAPAVKVAAISPTGTNTAVKKNGFMNYSTFSETSSISADQYTATVYNKGKKSWGVGDLQTYPQVTLALTNFGEATNAKMTFAESTGGEVKIYTGEASGQTSIFSWTRNSSGAMPYCLRYIGYYDDSNVQHWDPAGTLTSSTVVLTYDGVDYSFTVPTVTINNSI